MSNETKKKTVVTPVGRLVFDRNLFDPNDKGKRTASAIFEKSEDLSAVMAICKEEATKKWGNKIPKSLKMPVKEEKDEDKLEARPYLENMLIMNSQTIFEISIIDVANNALTSEDIKAGDYVRLAVSAFPYDKDGNKGIGLNVNGVLKVKDGEAFYNKPTASAFFQEQIQEHSSEAGEAFGNLGSEDSEGEGESTEDGAFNNFNFN